MPYYVFRKLVKADSWECLERCYDLQAASKAKNAYNMTLLAYGDINVFVTLVVADTETNAKATLEQQDAQQN